MLFCPGDLPKAAIVQHDAGYAAQARVLNRLKYRSVRIFNFEISYDWSPHSGRNVLSSATAALNYSKEDRDMIGD